MSLDEAFHPVERKSVWKQFTVLALMTIFVKSYQQGCTELCDGRQLVFPTPFDYSRNHSCYSSTLDCEDFNKKAPPSFGGKWCPPNAYYDDKRCWCDYKPTGSFCMSPEEESACRSKCNGTTFTFTDINGANGTLNCMYPNDCEVFLSKASCAIGGHRCDRNSDCAISGENRTCECIPGTKMVNATCQEYSCVDGGTSCNQSETCFRDNRTCLCSQDRERHDGTCKDACEIANVTCPPNMLCNGTTATCKCSEDQISFDGSCQPQNNVSCENGGSKCDSQFVCIFGYCVPLDQAACEEGGQLCPPNARCIDGRCECNSGFKKINFACYDVTPCEDGGSVCNNTDQHCNKMTRSCLCKDSKLLKNGTCWRKEDVRCIEGGYKCDDLQYHCKSRKCVSKYLECSNATKVEGELSNCYCVANFAENPYLQWQMSSALYPRAEGVTPLKLSFVLNRQHNLELFVCSSSLTNQELQRIRFNVLFEPSHIDLLYDGKPVEGKEMILVAGNAYTFICASSEARPASTLNFNTAETGWLTGSVHEGKQTNSYGEYGGHSSRKSIVLTANKFMKRPAFCCSVIYQQKSSLKICVNIKVLYGPEDLTMSVNGSDLGGNLSAVHGENYTVTCKTDAVALSVSMFFENVPAAFTSQVIRETEANGDVKFSMSMTFTAHDELNRKALKCIAINSHDHRLNRTESLNIRALFGPLSVTITSNSTGLVQGRLTVLAGHSILLTCVTDSVNERALLVWKYPPTLRANTVGTKTTESVYGGRTFEESLVISPSSSENGITVLCEASNAAQRTLKDTKTIHVDVLFGPLAVYIKLQNRRISGIMDVDDGFEYSPVCETDSVFPNCEIIWSYPTKLEATIRDIYPDRSGNHGGEIYNRPITFLATKDKHGVQIRCNATNPNVASVTVSTTLNVRYGPKDISLTSNVGSLENDILTLTEGQQVSLSCKHGDARPKALVSFVYPSFFTIAAEMILTMGTVHQVIGKSLTFGVHGRYHNARITCTAVNNETSAFQVETFVNLNIWCGPELRLSAKGGQLVGNVLHVIEGKQFEVTCHADFTNPAPTIQWDYDISVFVYVSEMKKNSKASSYSKTLIMTPNLEDFNTTLKCEIHNPKTGVRKEQEIPLQLTYGPSHLIIQANNRLIDSDELLLNNGVEYNVTCTTDLVYPNASITWTSTDFTLTESDISAISGDYDGKFYQRTMTFTPTIIRHDNFFNCTVLNTAVHSLVVTRQLKGVIVYAPNMLYIQPADGSVFGDTLNLEENKSHSIVCITDNWYPGCTLEWIYPRHLNVKVDVKTTVQRGTDGEVVYRKSMLYTAKREDNGQTVRCEGTNTGSADVRREHTMTLNVMFGPTSVHIMSKSLKYEESGRFLVRDGTESVLDCISTATNPPGSITWELPDLSATVRKPTIVRNIHGGVVHSRGIQFKVRRKHNDMNLRCVARHSELKHLKANQNVRLTVIYGPLTVSLKPSSGKIVDNVYSVRQGFKSTISCTTDTVNRNATITFTHPFQTFTIGDNRRLPHEQKVGVVFQRTLTFQPTNEHNGLAIMCKAANGDADVITANMSVNLRLYVDDYQKPLSLWIGVCVGILLVLILLVVAWKCRNRMEMFVHRQRHGQQLSAVPPKRLSDTSATSPLNHDDHLEQSDQNYLSKSSHTSLISEESFVRSGKPQSIDSGGSSHPSSDSANSSRI